MRGGPIRSAQRWGLLLADVHEVEPRPLGAAAHVDYCDHAELAQLAVSGRRWTYCPRTHAYSGHPPHRYRDMLAAGINVCLATDSRASNPDLSVLKEAKFLRERDDMDPYALLDMVTRRSEAALGMEEHAGAITPGKAADLTLLPWTGEGDAGEWAVRAAPAMSKSKPPRSTCTPIWKSKSAPWQKQPQQPRRPDATDRPISSSPFLRRSDYADPIAMITADEARFPALVGII